MQKHLLRASALAIRRARRHSGPVSPMKTSPELPVTLADIDTARKRIAAFVSVTPVATSHVLDERFGIELHFKCENLQKIGAFKARGAHNAVFSLTDAEASRGVITHSSGNHAAALSLAARNRGIPAYVVMPSNAAQAKIASVRRLGGIVTFCAPTLAAREAAAAAVGEKTGAILVHPFDDPRVIAGQGTCAREFLEQVPTLECLYVPLGGGGLLAGTAVAAQGVQPGRRVFGIEPAGAADGFRGFQSGQRESHSDARTIADGLRTAVGEVNFTIVRALASDILTVEEESIVAAMRLIWEVLKLVVEPSSAVVLAALLEGKHPPGCRRLGLILSGGNVDLDALPWMIKA